mgnify:CR=1 FL=1
MCGRFNVTSNMRQVAQVLQAKIPDLMETSIRLPDYNIAPTHAIAAATQDHEREIGVFRWGLLPSLSTDPRMGSRLINARSETVHDKPMFRQSVSGQRCLVLCDGYYEWQRTTSGRKQPYYFRLPDAEPMIFAGLWARNERLEGKVIETFCVITVPANVAAAVVHDRMPAILDRDGRSQWLDAKGVKRAELLSCLRPWPGEIEVLPVSTLVNNPANNSDRCIQALAADTKSI